MRHPRLLLLATAVALTGCAAGSDTPPVAATVDDTPVPVAEVDRMLASLATDPDVSAALDAEPQVEVRLRGQVLTQLVRSTVMRQEAAELGIDIGDDQVRAYVAENVDEHLGGRWASYERFKEAKRLSEADVLDQMRDDLYRDRIADEVAPEVSVPEDRVRDVYAEGWEGRSRVRHILLGTQEEALATRQRLEAGEDFAALVRELTLDEPSIDQGGDLGPWFPEQFDPAFDAAVRDARDGELVGPVETQFGFHVIERLAPPPFEAVREEIREVLLAQERAGRVDQWLAERLAEADIEVAEGFGSWDATTAAVIPDPAAATPSS